MNPLKRWRVLREMSQADLAAAVGMTQRAISYVEQGRMTNAKNYRKLQKLGIDIAELVTWIPGENND